MARPTEDEKKFRIQMRCNKEQYEHLAYLAEIQHISRSEVFRRMLRGVNVNAPEYIFRGHYKMLQSIRNELRRQGGLIKNFIMITLPMHRKQEQRGEHMRKR